VVSPLSRFKDPALSFPQFIASASRDSTSQKSIGDDPKSLHKLILKPFSSLKKFSGKVSLLTKELKCCKTRI
jgi:hypothetical protein